MMTNAVIASLIGVAQQELLNWYGLVIHNWIEQQQQIHLIVFSIAKPICLQLRVQMKLFQVCRFRWNTISWFYLLGISLIRS